MYPYIQLESLAGVQEATLLRLLRIRVGIFFTKCEKEESALTS